MYGQSFAPLPCPHFDPFAELTHDGQLAWMLHKYLGDIFQANRLIITERGYMGLSPDRMLAWPAYLPITLATGRLASGQVTLPYRVNI